jgi:hypothetical protein
MAARFAEYGRTVRVADVRGWPLCRRCARTRTIWFGVSLVTFWGGLVVFACAMLLGLLDMRAGGSLAAVACAGLAGMLVAVLPFRRGSLPRLIGARTAPDGREVIVERAHPAFVAALQGNGS